MASTNHAAAFLFFRFSSHAVDGDTGSRFSRKYARSECRISQGLPSFRAGNLPSVTAKCIVQAGTPATCAASLILYASLGASVGATAISFDFEEDTKPYQWSDFGKAEGDLTPSVCRMVSARRLPQCLATQFSLS
jgi:hypothetical protein